MRPMGEWERRGRSEGRHVYIDFNAVVELLSCILYPNQRLRAYENMCYLVDKYAP